MKHSLFILFLFLTAGTRAQNPGSNTDSLRNLLNTAKEDTSRILLLAQLGNSYQYYNPDSALFYDMKGLKLAQQINYKRGELFCRVSLAGYWWSIGDYATAIKLLLPEINDIESVRAPQLVTLAYAFLSNSYRDQGDFTEALRYQFKQANYDKNYLQCNFCRIINAAIASSYLGKNLLDSAHFYLRRAFTYAPERGFEGWIYSVAGKVYTEQKNYDSAFFYYRQGVQTLIHDKNVKDLAGAYNSMATLFTTTGSPDSAMFYARQALSVAQARRFAKEAMEAGLLLSKAYEAQNTDSALYYYKQAMAAKDSLYSQEKQRQILSYKFNEELRQQEATVQQTRYQNKLRMNTVMGITFTLLVIAILLWRNIWQRKKAYALLEKQKEEIDKQKREVEIEAALERVRSRSMAMQKSEELKEVIQLIMDQLCGLNFNIDSASFAVELNETDDLRIWAAAPGLKYATRINLPYIDNPVFNHIIEAKSNGVKFLNLTIGKEDKNKFFDHYFKYVPGIPEERKKYIYLSSGWASSNVLLDNLALNIQNYSGIPYLEKDNITLARFGKVFEQTYARFLDLQKAEASTKEAVKQASLDRVRGEIASMRTTSDLERITPLVWKELTILSVPFIRCGVFIMEEEEEMVQTYLSTPEGKALAVFQLPFHSEGIIQNVVSHWRSKQPFTQQWNAAAFSQWTKSLVEQGAIKSDERYSTDKAPENLHLHFIPFLQGMLYVGNTEQLCEEDIKLVQSLADAFSTAYARYEDFNRLENANQQIEIALSDLKAAQAQLIQSEKMASLGELTAGIAHEIQNPLNFVNNFSESNVELIEELEQEIDKGNIGEVKAIAADIKENELKIAHHGKRADAIVKGMLQHSRSSKGVKEPTNINVLADKYLRLAFHGLRAKDKDFNAAIETHFDESIGKIDIIPQDIGRVLLNLFNNAFYAVHEKKKGLNGTYEPTVTVVTKKNTNEVIIHVKDNGYGIPQKNVDKIFQPFFTTKPTGEGTGLGLSLSYDIIKAHGGELKVESTAGEGSTFIIQL